MSVMNRLSVSELVGKLTDMQRIYGDVPIEVVWKTKSIDEKDVGARREGECSMHILPSCFDKRMIRLFVKPIEEYTVAKKSKIRVDLRDPITKYDQDYVIGPSRMYDLVAKVYKIVDEPPPLRLRYMLFPELWKILGTLCKEHNTVIRNSVSFSDTEFRMLDYMGFVLLPSRIEAEKS